MTFSLSSHASPPLMYEPLLAAVRWVKQTLACLAGSWQRLKAHYCLIWVTHTDSPCITCALMWRAAVERLCLVWSQQTNKAIKDQEVFYEIFSLHFTKVSHLSVRPRLTLLLNTLYWLKQRKVTDANKRPLVVWDTWGVTNFSQIYNPVFSLLLLLYKM